jgi:hypothetical protein
VGAEDRGFTVPRPRFRIRTEQLQTMEDRHMDDGKENRPVEDGVANASRNGILVANGNGLPPLPRNIESFQDIRKKGCIYVDKTEFIANLLKRESRVFCARPRRFGKSLLLSTIETLFSEDPEHRAMFDGLYIAPYLSEWIFKPRPVISLDMSIVGQPSETSSPQESLSSFIDRKVSSYETLDEYARNYDEYLLRYVQAVGNEIGIKVTGHSAAETFRNLVMDAYISKGPVVVLVDEYEFPLIETIDYPDIYDRIRRTLRKFYLQVKGLKHRIFFAFFTGISKFSKVGIFSELNNLTDISMDEDYAAMYGYTKKELYGNFLGYVKKIIDKKKCKGIPYKIKQYYDGYTFDGCTHVYNPTTILGYLNSGVFQDYWMQSGSQEFVERYFYERKINLEKLDGDEISRNEIMSPKDIGFSSSPQTLLYQTGYLTIRCTSDDNKFTLTYPNLEVRNALYTIVFNNFFDNEEAAKRAKSAIRNAVASGNCEEVVRIFNNLLSGIHEKHSRTAKDVDSGEKENFYNGQLVAFLKGAELYPRSEAHSNKGIADIVAECSGKALVVESKYVDLTPKEDHGYIVSHYSVEFDCRKKLAQAVSQIYNKKYADPYPNPIPLAIVIDESCGSCISHAAYDKKAYRLDDKPSEFTAIGKVILEDKEWYLSFDSEITASKKPLPATKSRTGTTSQKAAAVKKAPAEDVESAVVASDVPRTSEKNISNLELTLCKLVMPSQQYTSLVIGVKEADDESLINTLKRLAQIVTQTQSASYWHTLSEEEKNKAFQDALEAKTSVMLSYLTQDGTFYLTAMDINRSETIGLLVTSTRQAAYGPYPLSHLLDDSSRLQSSFVQASLSHICKEQGVDETLPLPTPQQLLEWDETK